MSVGDILGGFAAAGSLASAGASIADGGRGPLGTSGASGAAYQPRAQGTFDNYYQQLAGAQIPGALNLPGQVIPNLTQYTTNLQQNPYAAQQLGAAQQVGAQGPGVAAQQFGGAGGLYGLGTSMTGLAPQLIQTAFDPQQTLYARTLQQIQDQQNAQAAMSGVAGTPYAAGVANQGISNFNIDWQNQQLQRQLAGARGLEGLATGAGRSFAGASDLGTGGLSTLLSAGGAPYTTYAGQQGADIAALQSLISGSSAIPGQGAYGNISSAYSPLQSYLNLGQGATGLAQSGQLQNFQQQQILGQQLATALSNPSLSSSLSGLFAPSSQPSFDPTFGTGAINPASDPMFDPVAFYGGGAGGY